MSGYSSEDERFLASVDELDDLPEGDPSLDDLFNGMDEAEFLELDQDEEDDELEFEEDFWMKRAKTWILILT
ncbi:MAG: hypothetical protein HC915_11715 [Anaerolineae bacterium]|nr:hypothetical protein [Anaerolineae bacterium]